jgi:hypothetical protein
MHVVGPGQDIAKTLLAGALAAAALGTALLAVPVFAVMVLAAAGVAAVATGSARPASTASVDTTRKSKEPSKGQARNLSPTTPADSVSAIFTAAA